MKSAARSWRLFFFALSLCGRVEGVACTATERIPGGAKVESYEKYDLLAFIVKPYWRPLRVITSYAATPTWVLL